MVYNVKNKTDLSGFYVVYKGSCQLEKPGIYGISHLMEHLMCKSFEHLFDTFERYSISWNAYTSSNEIVFHMTGLDEYINKYKYTFFECLSNFKLDEKTLENEKKIVIEEYKDCFNKQSASHYLNLFRKIYGFYDPIGLMSDLEKITLKDCMDFYELQYSKPSTIINISKKSN